jgi:endonuclease/exonuclease/phosphatase family metal-dependent hydrolase
MGDLNCSAHGEELKALFRQTSLVPPARQPVATYPSWQPRRAIDHILATTSISIEQLWTLPHPVSDHLPLAARVLLPEALRGLR